MMSEVRRLSSQRQALDPELVVSANAPLRGIAVGLRDVIQRFGANARHVIITQEFLIGILGGSFQRRVRTEVPHTAQIGLAPFVARGDVRAVGSLRHCAQWRGETDACNE